MRIGIGLPNQVRDVDAARIPRWAAAAEQAGFSTVATTGRLAFPGVLDTVALAAAAGATSSIGLLSAVCLAPTWPGVLLAKELADIDRVSGGRLTAGIGVGVREDDFVAAGHGARGRGARLDRDLESFHEVWRGAPVGGGTVPAVPGGARPVPLLFGGLSGPTLARMVRWGQGWIGPTLPAPVAGSMFEHARQAWRDGGRDGAPMLVATCYTGLVDGARARDRVRDYYGMLRPEDVEMIVGGIATSAAAVRQTVRDYAEHRIDELIFVPGTDDLDEIDRLAGAVLR